MASPSLPSLVPSLFLRQGFFTVCMFACVRVPGSSWEVRNLVNNSSYVWWRVVFSLKPPSLLPVFCPLDFVMFNLPMWPIVNFVEASGFVGVPGMVVWSLRRSMTRRYCFRLDAPSPSVACVSSSSGRFISWLGGVDRSQIIPVVASNYKQCCFFLEEVFSKLSFDEVSSIFG